MTERLIPARRVERHDTIVGDSNHRIGEHNLQIIIGERIGGLIHVVGYDTLNRIEHRSYEPDELVAVILYAPEPDTRCPGCREWERNDDDDDGLCRGCRRAVDQWEAADLRAGA